MDEPVKVCLERPPVCATVPPWAFILVVGAYVVWKIIEKKKEDES